MYVRRLCNHTSVTAHTREHLTCPFVRICFSKRTTRELRDSPAGLTLLQHTSKFHRLRSFHTTHPQYSALRRYRCARHSQQSHDHHIFVAPCRCRPACPTTCSPATVSLHQTHSSNSPRWSSPRSQRMKSAGLLVASMHVSPLLQGLRCCI